MLMAFVLLSHCTCDIVIAVNDVMSLSCCLVVMLSCHIAPVTLLLL